jgi:hypothetical protein
MPIDINKSRSAIDLAAQDRVSILGAELTQSKTEQPPIMIMSDGTPEGTMLLVHGQPVSFKCVEMWCSNDPDYSHCNISITIKEAGSDGIEIEKTLRLRKDVDKY